MKSKELKAIIELHKIGECPICKRGKMLQGTAGWTCDFFKSMQEKCRFTIFKVYDGYELTEEDAITLITKGQTGEKNFISKSGKQFKGSLKVIGAKVKVTGHYDIINIRCPKCGGQMRVLQNGVACENYFQEKGNHCPVWIPTNICNRKIGKEEILSVLETGRTEVLDGFNIDGKTFSSILIMNNNGESLLEGKICRCPKCGGNVYAGEKAYNCSNYRNPSIKCDFTIWREISGKRITISDVQSLCYQGRTGLCTFYNKEKMPYERTMIFSEDWKVKLI